MLEDVVVNIMALRPDALADVTHYVIPNVIEPRKSAPPRYLWIGVAAVYYIMVKHLEHTAAAR